MNQQTRTPLSVLGQTWLFSRSPHLATDNNSQKFFNYDAMPIMKALAPFSILQQVLIKFIFRNYFIFQLKSYDMIIAVQGLGGGNVANFMSKGRDSPRQAYNSSINVKMYPYKEATPWFGQGPDHHTALNNGGMKIATLIA